MTKSSDDAVVLEALRSVGIVASSVDDLVNDRVRYGKDAIRTLVRLLPTITDDRIKEAMVRACGVRAARGVAGRTLVDEFKRLNLADKAREHSIRWAIGNSLSVAADDSLLPDILELVRDRKYGPARQMLTVALSRFRSREAVECLIECLEDEELAGHAVVALGKLKARSAESALDRFTAHREAWIRKAAKAALARIREKPD